MKDARAAARCCSTTVPGRPGIRLSLIHIYVYKRQVLKEKEAFIHANQREPSLAELAEIMGVKEKDIAESLESLQSVVSIFEPIYNDDGDTLYLLDQIKDDHDEIGKLSSLIALKMCIRDRGIPDQGQPDRFQKVAGAGPDGL